MWRALLGLRLAGRRYGGLWALPGGHLEPGETARQAVVRELAEELGVRAELHPDGPAATSMIGAVQRSVWLVAAWQGRPSNHAPEEHAELRWFAAEELAGIPLAHPQDGALIARVLRAGASPSG